jgi:hypothetical protein
VQRSPVNAGRKLAAMPDRFDLLDGDRTLAPAPTGGNPTRHLRFRATRTRRRRRAIPRTPPALTWRAVDARTPAGARQKKPRRGMSGVSEQAIWGLGELMIALSGSTVREGPGFLAGMCRGGALRPKERPAARGRAGPR